MQLEGIHHITAITADAQGNVDFYAGVLGLRLVKKSVNQDDTSVYHLFYADETGDPGSDMTFFEYPGLPAGRAGAGMVHRVVWRVSGEEALDFWAKRLSDQGYDSSRERGSLTFKDPEGLEHELVTVATTDDAADRESPGDPSRARPARLRCGLRIRDQPRAQPGSARADPAVRKAQRDDLRGAGRPSGRPLRLRPSPGGAPAPGRGHNPPRRLGSPPRG